MITHSRPTLNKTDYKAIMKVMDSGFIVQGEKVKEFEKVLASYIGVKGGVATSSGTSALHLALIALGIKEGDEVILPTYVCTAPLNAIYYTGAKPVIVDITGDGFNLSIPEVKKRLTEKTKAIIVPHMFGHPVDMDEIVNIGVPVIEDCAHSIGAGYKKTEYQSIRVSEYQSIRASEYQKVGSFGALSIFSFYATKMLASGEGGMVLSNDKKLLSRIKDIRDYDEKDKFKLRFNYKMTDMEAALGLNQLKKLPLFIKRRKDIAEKYNNAFSGCSFTTPSICKGRVFYRYVIRVEGNVEIYITGMRDKGIECKKPVYKPIHQYFGLKEFPVAEKVHKSAISIPIYPSLTDEEVNFIIKTIISINR